MCILNFVYSICYSDEPLSVILSYDVSILHHVMLVGDGGYTGVCVCVCARM